ncbi:MAG TPA: ComF family protein, partial [Candidatus Binataceae bacterium]|nr:ComF family protein [Candidatus Binataceae bacterium]
RFSLDESRRVCAPCLRRVERITHPICPICGAPMESSIRDDDRCVSCADRPPYFASARSVARYRPSAEGDRRSLPALIRRHKYGLEQSLHAALAEFLGDELPYSADDFDVLMPVPLHQRRLWWRGFNQAALLAMSIARRFAKPIDLKSLTRTRMTTPQTSQDHDARRRNVRRAFAVKHPARVRGKRLLLIDDVMTTGATVDECSRVLMAAGAARVDVLTLARVL